MTDQQSSFNLKLALPCAVAGGRRDGLELDSLAWEAGRQAAREALPIESPLLDLSQKACRTGAGWEGPRWSYELAYWTQHEAVRPADYFDLQLSQEGPAWVLITSLGRHGGKGSVLLHKTHLRSFFCRARTPRIEAFGNWAAHPHTPAVPELLRMWTRHDEDTGSFVARERDEEGRLCLDPNAHPSYGCLYFGDPTQELRQLAALLKLEVRAAELVAAAALDEPAMERARRRAAGIRSKAPGPCFVPHSGVCAACGSDVTESTPAAELSHATACPKCAWSWCE